MPSGIQAFGDNAAMTSHDIAVSSSNRSERSEPPKRLRYWLIDMINSGEIPGLRWENAGNHRVFRIPWKHAGKNNWKEEDCKIFQAWAEHRGKYKKGDKVEAATWKTRLRCALNKLPDIKELKDLSNLEGNEPYRVYELLPEPDKAQDSEIYPRSSWGKESPNSRWGKESPNGGWGKESPTSHMTQSPSHFNPSPGYMEGSGFHAHHQHPTHMGFSPGAQRSVHPSMRDPSLITTPPMGPTIPTTEFRKLNVDERKLISHQNGFRINKLDIISPEQCTDMALPLRPNVQRNPSCEAYETLSSPGSSGHPTPLMPQHSGVSPGGSPVGHFINMDTYNNAGTPMMDTREVLGEIPLPDTPPKPYEMEIYIRYKGHLVIATHVTNQCGCRVHYGDANVQLIAMAHHNLPSGVFGPVSLSQIELVDCERYATNEKQVQLTKHVLNNIVRGLIIQFEDDCFYVKRLCQSRVFITSPESDNEVPDRLEKYTKSGKVLVFDNQKFLERLRRYITEGKMKPPEIEVNASFGQTWSIKAPLEKNLVTLTMYPRFAKFLRHRVRQQHNRFVSLNDSILSESGPDSYDRVAELATRQSVKGFDDFIQQMLHGDPNFLSLVQPMNEQPAANRDQNGFGSRSGYFQPNTFTQTPIVPPVGLNDVEMTGYYGEQRRH